MWQVEIGAFAVPWESRGEEWLNLVMGLAARPGVSVGGQGSGTKGGPVFAYACGRSSGLEDARDGVAAFPEDNALRCVVFGAGDGADDDVVEVWRRAVAKATSDVGNRDRDFPWEAIIGPHPAGRLRLNVAPLAREFAAGAVRLVPGGVYMRDVMARAHPGIRIPRTFSYSWPVIASGSVRAHDFQAAAQLAQGQLAPVCALLSLIWGEYWFPREGPRISTLGNSVRLSVPQVSEAAEVSLPDPVPYAADVYKGDRPLTVPPWISAGLEHLTRDAVLRRAVGAFWEALSLDVAHPSAAYLMYVAAIEGIGERLVGGDARRRFLAALETVDLPDEHHRLLKDAYRRRSATGHSGKLHDSDEDPWDRREFNLFWLEPGDLFGLINLGVMRSACRRVVLGAVESTCGTASQDATGGDSSR